MERRDFLKFAFGVAAGAGAVAAATSVAIAAPMLSPHQDLMDGPKPEPDMAAKPAVGDQDDARAEPEQVHWRRRHYRRHYHRHYRRHHRRHYRRHYRRW